MRAEEESQELTTSAVGSGINGGDVKRVTVVAPTTPWREPLDLSNLMSSDDDDDDDDEEDDEDYDVGNEENVSPRKQQQRNNNNNRPNNKKALRPSLLLPKNSKGAGGGGSRRPRRRSSARFVNLTSSGNDKNDIDPSSGEGLSSSIPVIPASSSSQRTTEELYKHVIRLNAENRITAANSWNLPLIEQMDQFLTEEVDSQEDEDVEGRGDDGFITPRNGTSDNKDSNFSSARKKRVNFTKASCTLDASVKIYSYRVDDIHLTSYKVLANLNRTDGNKKGNNSDSTQGDHGNSSGNAADAADDDTGSNARKKSSSGSSTLETNLANINMNKLDSAFDIDPLFHKMSKAFDEGGARGLLLVNLGVGARGCKIVFDSSESDLLDEPESEMTNLDNTESTKKQSENGNGEHKGGSENQESSNQNGMVDISCIKTQLESALEGQRLESLSLVPQLADLRADYEQLESDGFVDNGINAVAGIDSSRKGRYYAPAEEEEREADRSIHQEALERSMARSFVEDGAESEHKYEQDDMGGGFDDGEDDDGFTEFMALDENGERFSGISFARSSLELHDQEEHVMVMPEEEPPTQTAILLDAITSGGHLLEGKSDYEYFKADTVLSQMTMPNGTNWAGSAHWKRSKRQTASQDDTGCMTPTATGRKTPSRSAKKSLWSTRKTPRSTKKLSKERTFVSLSSGHSLTDILLMPPARKRGSADPLRISATTLTKYSKTENALPVDAGINLDQLSSLFMRPGTAVKYESVNGASSLNQHYACAGSQRKKSVGFDMAVETFSMAGNLESVDDAFGDDDDDDGPGFCFADEGVIDEDEQGIVHELDGVRKVEKVQVGYATVAKKVDVKRLKRDLWADLEDRFSTLATDPGEEDCISVQSTDISTSKRGVSFKKVVQDMESRKSQVDVTFPFYFICALHLANEKGLRLESTGLEDFEVFKHDGDFSSQQPF